MKRLLFTAALLLIILTSETLLAQSQGSPSVPIPKIGIDIGTADSPEDISVTLQLLLFLTVLSLAPSLLIMTTCYLRIIIAFHFMRQALGTMQMPPKSVDGGYSFIYYVLYYGPNLEQGK